MDGGVHQKVVEISQLPSTAAVAGDYGNVRYLAQQLLGVMVSEVMKIPMGLSHYKRIPGSSRPEAAHRFVLQTSVSMHHAKR